MVLEQYIKPEDSESGINTSPIIIFEYDLLTKKETASPHVSQYIAGNYDGRLLSQVMLEDDVIHPQDVKKSLQLRREVIAGKGGEILLRLKTPTGSYRWFRMTLIASPDLKSNRMVGIFQDVEQEVQLQSKLYYSATMDSTSGIYNKHTFYYATETLLSSDPNQAFCLVRFDIDRFKIINELYTIDSGDLVLRYVGSILRTLLPSGSSYGRLGNDIFCFCTKHSPQKATALVLEIERLLNQYPIQFSFHLSAGIVCILQYKQEPINLLCDWAALAQKTVKGNYMKKYAFYNPVMSKALNWEHYIVSNMEQGLREGQFQIYLQPQYDLQTKRIIGAEALVRWIHPSEGLLAAGQFIPLFEKNGCILQLDTYVWEGTAKLLRKWMDWGIKPIPISVNVSRMHVHDLTFSSKILDICTSYGIPPLLLELEITESAYVESPQALYDIMDDLQARGSIFLMDDFGSGYSSLNVLKDIPVNIVKIDLNFLRDSRRGKDTGRKILCAVVQLVQSIGLPIIVEGVETEEQLQFLLEIGCTQAQGFYFSKPIPIPAFEELLLKNTEFCSH